MASHMAPQKSSVPSLFKSIRAKCLQDQCFGSEQSSPAWNEDVPVDDLKRFDFAFLPASEEQLSITEKLLGFTLPQLLRALYAEVANGGFGPGEGCEERMGNMEDLELSILTRMKQL